MKMSTTKKMKRLFAKSDVTVHSKVDDRIVGDALTAFGKSEETMPVSSGPSIRRMIMNSRTAKLAAAAAVVVAAFVVISQFGGSVNVSSVAWADVLENVEAARTVMCTLEIENGDNREVFTSRVMEPYHWRLDAIESPYDYQASIHDGRINKCLLLYPHTKMAVLNTDEGHPGYKVNTYERLKRDFRDGTEKNLGQVVLSGCDTVCFEISNGNKRITVWADPTTAIPIQIEETWDANGSIKRILRSDIKFDIEFDEQLFSLTPPEDYCLLDFETGRIQTPFELTEKHLVEGLAVYPKYLDGGFPTRFKGGRPMTEEVRKKCREEVAKLSWTDEEANKSSLACEFIERLPEGSDYQYVGENVKLGDAEAPVCWWKPPGSKTYRVIYGGLSVRDVEPDDLPKVPWLDEKK
jgi:hypothetical protein